MMGPGKSSQGCEPDEHGELDDCDESDDSEGEVFDGFSPSTIAECVDMSRRSMAEYIKVISKIEDDLTNIETREESSPPRKRRCRKKEKSMKERNDEVEPDDGKIFEQNEEPKNKSRYVTRKTERKNYAEPVIPKEEYFCFHRRPLPPKKKTKKETKGQEKEKGIKAGGKKGKAQKKSVTTSVDRSHYKTEREPFFCIFCQYGRKKACDIHQRLEAYTRSVLRKPKRYTCDDCPFVASDAWELEEHSRTQHYEETFVCNVCGCKTCSLTYRKKRYWRWPTN